jgi:hypothetical protein
LLRAAASARFCSVVFCVPAMPNPFLRCECIPVVGRYAFDKRQ